MNGSSQVPSWVTLSSDEKIVWTGHPSIRPVGWSLVIGIVLIGLGIGVAVILTDILRLLSLVLIVPGLAVLSVTYINYRSVQYVLTSEEVYKKTGVFSRSVTTLRLDRVQNTSYTQSFLERVLSYGTINIDTAGSEGTELVLESVPNPERVNGLLAEQLDAVSASQR